MALIEQTMVARLSAGDPQAWRQLYDAHFARIWRYVARVLGDGPADVADVVQEVFLAAARSAGDQTWSCRTPLAWLYGVARNQVALFFRRQDRSAPYFRQSESENGQSLCSWLVGPAVAAETLLELDERTDLIRFVLARLWPGYAELLVSKYIEEQTIDEIASQSSQSAEAVRSKLARARRAFRESFERLASAYCEVAKEA